MKYFDMHQHYGFMEFMGKKVEVPKNMEPNDYFEEAIVKKCKELDMVVAVNGYGRCNKSLAFLDMNDEVEKFFKKNEKFIIGIGYVDLDYDSPTKIDHLFKKGFSGIKILFPEYRYDDNRYFNFYVRCEYYDLPILFHTGVSYLESAVKNVAGSFI